MDSHKIMRKGGGRRVFNEAQELEITRRVLIRGERRQAIADELGVHRNTVANIVDRRTDQVCPTQEAA